MNLCKECYAKVKLDPNILRKGVGISKFNGGKLCEDCGTKVDRYVVVEDVLAVAQQQKAAAFSNTPLTPEEKKAFHEAWNDFQHPAPLEEPLIDYSKGNFFRSSSSRSTFRIE